MLNLNEKIKLCRLSYFAENVSSEINGLLKRLLFLPQFSLTRIFSADVLCFTSGAWHANSAVKSEEPITERD